MKYINTTQNTYTTVEDTNPNATATIIAVSVVPPQGDPLEIWRRRRDIMKAWRIHW